MYLPDRGSWETSASYAENSSKVGNTGVCLSVLCYLAPDWLCCRMHAMTLAFTIVFAVHSHPL